MVVVPGGVELWGGVGGLVVEMEGGVGVKVMCVRSKGCVVGWGYGLEA